MASGVGVKLWLEPSWHRRTNYVERERTTTTTAERPPRRQPNDDERLPGLACERLPGLTCEREARFDLYVYSIILVTREHAKITPDSEI